MKINFAQFARSAFRQFATRSGACCGTPGSKRLVFGDPDLECCADLSDSPPSMTPTFDDLFTGEARSGEWVVPAIDCPVEITVTSVVSNTPIAGETLQIKLIVNGSAAIPAIPVNGSATFTIQAGDQINIEAQTDLLGSEYCHDLHFNIFNATCGINYPNVTQLFLNGTPDCVLCPWNFEDIETGDRDYLEGPYTNTTNQAVQYDFTSVTTITFNASTTIVVYYGSNPVYNLNPFVKIVEFGLSLAPQSVVVAPGEKLWIYFDNLGNGLLSQYEIDLTVSSDCWSASDTFEVTLNKFAVPTYYILAETGDILNAENNDKLRTETP